MTTLVVFYYLSESEILPDKRREVIFGGSCLIRIGEDIIYFNIKIALHSS
jgi:hypothetical protein